MQDELTKHSRKIYKALKGSGGAFTNKIKEVLIEIFIIVFSVTLSIWLHSWSEHKHQQKETKEFLADLKDDLEKDVKSMSEQNAKLSEMIHEYSYLRNLTEKQIDSISSSKASLSINVFHAIRNTNNGNYEGFKSSGKIGYIENKKLKKLILEYYQESMPALTELERYYNSRLTKIEDIIYQNKEKTKLFLNPIAKTSFDFAILTAKSNQNNYNLIEKDAKEIISEINKELKD